jgi:hypothetical protein
MAQHWDRVWNGLLLAAALFLAFVGGAWVAWEDTALFKRSLRKGFIGADAFLAERRARSRPLGTGVWEPASDGGPFGVVRSDPTRASAGATLVVVGQSAHLIDLDGTVLHSWHLDYEAIRGPGAMARAPMSRARLLWRPARALPNGDLIALVDFSDAATPQGLALVRLDRDSRPLWVFHGHVHHDFDIAPDGRIFVLGQGLRERPPKGLAALRGPLADEQLYVLSPEGKLLRTVSIVKALGRSRYVRMIPPLVGRPVYTDGDYLHSNNVDYADGATAARFDFVKEGQVLLSLRNIDLLAVLDVGSETVTWARRGEWMLQHDPDFLENGNLMLFDNQGDGDRGGGSRVIEYDPRTSAIVWQYPGATGAPLKTSYRGEQQLLPNGDVLLNEFQEGRLLEVTRAGEVVWEYRCPFRYPGDERLVCLVLHAERYPPGTLRFAFNHGAAVDPRQEGK